MRLEQKADARAMEGSKQYRVEVIRHETTYGAPRVEPSAQE